MCNLGFISKHKIFIPVTYPYSVPAGNLWTRLSGSVQR